MHDSNGTKVFKSPFFFFPFDMKFSNYGKAIHTSTHNITYVLQLLENSYMRIGWMDLTKEAGNSFLQKRVIGK